MQAIELETEIDENHEIHVKLPDAVRAGKARILVLYDETTSERKPRKFGQFRGQVEMSDDFDDPLQDDLRASGKR